MKIRFLTARKIVAPLAAIRGADHLRIEDLDVGSETWPKASAIADSEQVR